MIFGIADMTSAQGLHVSLTLSTHGSYNISCFGGSDGTISTTVTGGTSPYTYSWSNGSTTSGIIGRRAGYYSVTVTDNANNTTGTECTLTEPGALQLSLTPYHYANNYNISCWNCFNGSITSSPSGGVTPYTYAWSNGSTTKDITVLAMGTYSLVVTDNNGCTITSENLTLTEPIRSTWIMSGNTGSNPSSEYIGTADNTDLVFKTNATQRLRMFAGGKVTIGTATTAPSEKLKVEGDVNVTGIIKIGTANSPSTGTTNHLLLLGAGGTVYQGPVYPIEPPQTLCGTTHMGWFSSNGNDMNSCGAWVGIGVEGDPAAPLQVDGTSYFNGQVGIGTSAPATGYSLDVRGKIRGCEIKVNVLSGCDYVFENDYSLLPLKALEKFLQQNHHLPGIAPAKEMEANGINVGENYTLLLKKIEELTLYTIQLEKRIEGLEKK